MSSMMQGAGAGATMGAALGSVVPGIGTAIGTVGGGLLGGALGGLFGKPKETPMQQHQKELIDELLASVKGQGKYSNLFNMDEGAFQKSYVEPAKSLFRNQIAPQIQQQYIGSGQQRGSGMEDSLTRAGVEMDQLLNQHYQQMQQQAQQNQLGAMNTILGQGAGVPQLSGMEAFGQGMAGYMAKPQFGEQFGNLFSNFGNKQGQASQTGGAFGGLSGTQPSRTTEIEKPLAKGYTG